MLWPSSPLHIRSTHLELSTPPALSISVFGTEIVLHKFLLYYFHSCSPAGELILI